MLEHLLDMGVVCVSSVIIWVVSDGVVGVSYTVYVHGAKDKEVIGVVKGGVIVIGEEEV